MPPPNPLFAETSLIDRRLQGLFEEYRALYSLVLFRMGALERRVPIGSVMLTGFLGSVTVMPLHAQLLVFISVPLALFWFVRSTVTHARSLEDALRRIEELEQQATLFLGDQILRFQSQHPSRGRHIGGRISSESIAAVMLTAILLILACFYLFLNSPEATPAGVLGYSALLLGVLGALAWIAHHLPRYRYRQSGLGHIS